MNRPLLQFGSKGPTVRELQKLLAISVDGDFGPATKTAVQAFQKLAVLTQDGVVGPATWRALLASAPPATPPPDPLLAGPALVLPITPQGVPYLWVGSPFGPRVSPITGKSNSFHGGLDLLAVKGRALVAVGSGLVGKVQELHPVNGNAVFLDVQGYRICYLHLSKIEVRQGDPVVVGQQIGQVGTTGSSTGPHLHLTVYDPAGNRIDPATLYPRDWLISRKTREPVLP